jgi:hypothetical protein
MNIIPQIKDNDKKTALIQNVEPILELALDELVKQLEKT